MPEIQMPKLSDTMMRVLLHRVEEKEGRPGLGGEVLAEIETDKATMEWEIPEDGTLTEIYVRKAAR
jgi:pyruvate/2-oxoglutarate dehydrogenase complex dihydrolipoamide acyltransferase (E2) component